MEEDLLENAACVDKDVAFFVKRPVFYLDCDGPLSFVFIPASALDRVLIFDVFFNIILRHRFLQILVDLTGRRIVIRPLRIRLEGIRIVMRWNITLAAGIAIQGQNKADGRILAIDFLPILQPSSANVVAAFVNNEFCIPVLHALAPDDSHENARISSAQANHTNWPVSVDWLFAYVVRRAILAQVRAH